MNKIIKLLGPHHKLGNGVVDPPNFLPDEIREFYKYTNGALFGINKQGGSNFRVNNIGYYYKILPMEHLASVYNHKECNKNNLINDKMINWAMIIDYGDYDYVAVDLKGQNRGKLIDVWHESVGDDIYHPIISDSFLKFIDKCKNEPGVWWLSAQQVDAPEPATMVSPASQIPQRPAR